MEIISEGNGYELRLSQAINEDLNLKDSNGDTLKIFCSDKAKLEMLCININRVHERWLLSEKRIKADRKKLFIKGVFGFVLAFVCVFYREKISAFFLLPPVIFTVFAVLLVPMSSFIIYRAAIGIGIAQDSNLPLLLSILEIRQRIMTDYTGSIDV